MSPGTARGGLPQSLFSIANDDDVEAILAEIPFISVGILAFAVFTFFLALKRVNLLATYLFASALAAFLAAMVDLVETLAERQATTSASISVSNPRTVFRDILLSLSIGIRFLFFWTFVATCPRAEASSHIQQSTSIFFTRREGYHSAAWSRWSFLGIILKWGLLLLTILITTLQIVWRVTNNGGAIYFAEATMEIVVSIVFILKLLMNTWLATATPVMKTLKYYAVAIIVLILVIAIAIGNITSFEFSESILGRFLQAVGLYILLLFILISTFSKPRSRSILVDTPSQQPSKIDYADKSFRGLTDWQTRQSVFQITPPAVLTPEEAYVVNPNFTQNQSRPTSYRNSVRFSDTGSNVSGWKFKKPSTRPMSRMPPDPLRVINLDDPERGYSMEKGRPLSLTPAEERSTALPYLSVEQGTPEPNVIFKSQWSSRTVGQNPAATRSNKTLVGPPVPGPSMSDEPLPYEPSSVISYYGTTEEQSPNTTRFKPSGENATEEPVYSLDGIQPPSPATLRPQRPRSSVVSFNEMLRQQQVLDDSIAALRLLTPAQAQSKSPSEETFNGKNEASTEVSRASRSRSVATVSASARSDFSLSVFPDPPEEGNGFAAAAALAAKQQSENGPSRDPATEQQQPPKILAVHNDARRKQVPMNVESLDLTTTTGGLRVDSGATQYDVTSFIGDLTSPGHADSGSITRTLSDGDETSSILTAPSVAILTAQRKPLPAKPVFNPATASGTLSSTSDPEYRDEQNQESSSPTSPIATQPAPSSLNTRWAGRGGGAPGGLPARPRLPIGGRRPSPPDGERIAPDGYERQRLAAHVLTDSNQTNTTRITAPPGAF